MSTFSYSIHWRLFKGYAFRPSFVNIASTLPGRDQVTLKFKPESVLYGHYEHYLSETEDDRC